MVFSSISFIYLFLPILILFYFMVKNNQYRKMILVIFSLLFYAWGEPIYVLLLLLVVAINYLLGNIIEKYEKIKIIVFVLGVLINIGILIYYKYFTLILITINQIFSLNITAKSIRLPLGISFYIFQSLSYIIDVYKNKTRAQKNFFSLLLYISFFPQLIAGPIVKYIDIVDEIDDRRFKTRDAYEGVLRFVIGLSKKVLLANRLGKLVSILLVFNADTSLYSIWLGIILFLLQLYFDFSGYSDMAIGLGLVFGFHFKENFNYPYMSVSITEFWRRWHISLSSFFKEYVYIPLGGNRKHQIINIIIVWGLTGIWHGASWNFLLWGLYFAILLIVEKVLMKCLIIKNNLIVKGFAFIYTKIVLLIGFILFYFTDFSLIVEAYKYMFLLKGNLNNGYYALSILKENIIIIIIGILASTPILKNFWGMFIENISSKKVIIIEYVFIIFMLALCTFSIISESYNPFLYFRF